MDPEKWQGVGGKVLDGLVVIAIVVLLLWLLTRGGPAGHQPNDDCLPGVSC